MEGKDREGLVTRLTHWTTKTYSIVMLWFPGSEMCNNKGTFSKWHGSHFLTSHARRLVSCPAHAYASWWEVVQWMQVEFLGLIIQKQWDCEISNYYVALYLQLYSGIHTFLSRFGAICFERARLHCCKSMHYPKKFDLVHRTIFLRGWGQGMRLHARRDMQSILCVG